MFIIQWTTYSLYISFLSGTVGVIRMCLLCMIREEYSKWDTLYIVQNNCWCVDCSSVC